MTIRSLIVGGGGGTMTATGMARALLARGMTDAQIRAAIGGASSVLAGLTAVLATPAPAPTPAPSPTPTPTPTPAPTPTVAIPTGFPMSSLPFAITRSGSGEASTFATDYSHAARRPATSTTIYVSTTGSVEGTGTQADPVPSISMAIAMGNATGAPYAIEVAAGTYLATTAFTRTAAPAGTYQAAWYNRTPTQSIAIYCPSGRAVSTQMGTAPAWVATADPNIWRANLSYNHGRWAADASRLDDTGMATGMDRVQTVADAAAPFPEMNAAWTADRGVAALLGNSTVYVRTFDNRQPDANVRVFRDFGSVTGHAGMTTAATAPLTIWMENMSFHGGRTVFKVIATASAPVNTYTRECRFAYQGANSSPGSDGAGAFAHEGGGGTIIHENVVASYTAYDGLNYHGAGGGAVNSPTVYEIGAQTRSTGWNRAGTNNGSTLHEDCIGVRVGGSYLLSADRAVHDINNSRSWNLGCAASTRRGLDGTDTSAAWAAGRPSQTDTTSIWLDACTVKGAAQYAFEAYPSSTIYHANMTPAPSSDRGGNVTAYVG